MITLRNRLGYADAEIDLVPMIDCVFLMLLFFMLCGHISMEDRGEQITVPPAKTASTPHGDWPRQVVAIRHSAEGDVVVLAKAEHAVGGPDDGAGWRALRSQLDRIHDAADTYPDRRMPGLRLPRVVIEIRADADTAYRTVQDLERVLADTDADARDGSHERRRPFVDLDFTARDPSAR